MKILIGILLLFSIQVCYARGLSSANKIHPLEYDVSDVATEIVVLRPLGLIGSVAGAAVFIGTAPLSLLASIAPPHDVIFKALDVLVIGPANASIKRPFAYYHYDALGEYPEVLDYSASQAKNEPEDTGVSSSYFESFMGLFE
jgi:hypothetical protein